MRNRVASANVHTHRRPTSQKSFGVRTLRVCIRTYTRFGLFRVPFVGPWSLQLKPWARAKYTKCTTSDNIHIRHPRFPPLTLTLGSDCGKATRNTRTTSDTGSGTVHDPITSSTLWTHHVSCIECIDTESAPPPPDIVNDLAQSPDCNTVEVTRWLCSVPTSLASTRQHTPSSGVYFSFMVHF